MPHKGLVYSNNEILSCDITLVPMCLAFTPELIQTPVSDTQTYHCVRSVHNTVNNTGPWRVCEHKQILPHSNSHFSTQTWVSQYKNVFILGFIGAKNDRDGGCNCSCKMCKAPVKKTVKSSPPTNQHPMLYRPDALPVAQPTVSNHWRERTQTTTVTDNQTRCLAVWTVT